MLCVHVNVKRERADGTTDWLLFCVRSLHTGGAPSKERQDPRFDSITKLMSTIFNMCAPCPQRGKESKWILLR